MKTSSQQPDTLSAWFTENLDFVHNIICSWATNDKLQGVNVKNFN